MTIQYKTIEKAQPGIKGGGERKETAAIAYTDTIKEDKFRKKLAESSRRSEADMLYFLMTFKDVLMEYLQNGSIVQTGVLGTFYPTIKNKNKGTAGRIKASDLEPGINYRPSKDMRRAMGNTVVKKKG